MVAWNALLPFVLGTVGVAITSAQGARWLLPRAGPSLRVLGGMALFPVVVLGLMLPLGTAGLLRPWVVAAAAAGIAVVFLTIQLALSARLAKPDSRMGEAAEGTLEASWGTLASVTLLAALATVIAARRMTEGTSFGPDGLNYHAPAVAHWVVDGQLTIKPLNYQAYYPLNGEVFVLWFVLPFGRDGMACVAGLYWLALAVASVAVGVRQLGGQWRMAALAGAVVLVARPALDNAQSFAAVDLAGAAMVWTACVWMLPWLRSEEPGTPRRIILLSGLCGGVAFGTKVSVAPVLAMVAAWILCGGRKDRRMRGRLLDVGVFALGVVLAGGYWYVRDFIVTGNPLFPAQTAFFGGPLDAASQQRTKLISWLAARPGDVETWHFLIKGYADWPYPVFLLSAGGYVAALVGWVRSLRRRSAAIHGAAAPARWQGLLAAAGLVALLAFPFTPFSGTVDSPSVGLKVQTRYVILPFLAGIPLLLASPRGQRWAKVLFAAILVTVAVCTAYSEWNAWQWQLLAGAAAMGAAWLCSSPVVLHRLRTMRWSPLTVGAVLLPLVAALAAAEPHLFEQTTRGLFRTREAHPARAAWEKLDTLAPGSRVGWYGKLSYRYYPCFGRRLQLVPCQLDSTGKPTPPLHQRWRDDPRSCQWWKWDEPDCPPSLVDNLKAARIDYVLVSDSPEGRWPPQDQAIRSSGQARLVFEDEHSRIWQVRP